VDRASPSQEEEETMKVYTAQEAYRNGIRKRVRILAD
jgi:hypothetical protein